MTDNLCPHKKLCGSCAWSHIPYDKQLNQKLSDINGSFALHHLPDYCQVIVPAPKTSHYRNRMDFTINFQGKVGLREKGKWWSIIDGHPCFISDEKIEEHFFHCREWAQSAGITYFDRKKHHGVLRYAVIRATLSGQTIITIITSEAGEEAQLLQEKLLELYEQTKPTSLVHGICHTVSDVSRGDTIVPIYGDPWIIEEIGGYQYEISPHDFFQTNSSGAEILMETVMEYVQEASPKSCLDLYCGSGFFTLPLTQYVKNPMGIELVPEAIKTAKRNAERNNLEITFEASKVEDFPWATSKPDTIIVDPPRSGLHDSVISEIQKQKPDNIVYVSCNYKALARELEILRDDYEVKEMKAIDMFPHTPHVEVVTLLRAN